MTEMCGLFGLVASKTADADELAAAVALLATLNVARGEDGWGLWHGTQVLIREAGPPRDVFSLARDALHQRPTWPLCGHTRLATRGAAIAANAHPFAYEGADGTRYVAAHNGGVRPAADAPEALGMVYTSREVDSDAFFASLFLENARASSWEGWGAFVWTSQGKRGAPKLHMGCATQSELAVVTIRDRSSGAGLVTLWSSETEHLRAAVRIVLRPSQATWHTMSPGYWHVEATGPGQVAEHDTRYDFERLEPIRYYIADSLLWSRRSFPLLPARDEGDNMSKVWPEYVPVRRRRRRRNK